MKEESFVEFEKKIKHWFSYF